MLLLKKMRKWLSIQMSRKTGEILFKLQRHWISKLSKIHKIYAYRRKCYHGKIFVAVATYFGLFNKKTSVSSKTQIETDPKKPDKVKNWLTNRNSPIFELSLRNLVKMTYYYGGPLGQVSWWYLKNCGFFISSQFLTLSGFFGSVSIWRLSVNCFDPVCVKT